MPFVLNANAISAFVSIAIKPPLPPSCFTVSILLGDETTCARAAGTMFVRSLNLLQGIPSVLGKEIFLVHQFNPVCLRERYRPRATEHDVRRFFHYQPGEADRTFYMLDAANRAGLQCLSIHDGRIHLVCAGASENRTASGVEVGLLLEHAHGRFRCVKTRSAALQNFVTSTQRPLKPCAIFALFFRCDLTALNRSGAAVNRESNFLCFHIWIVVGLYFRCRFHRPLSFLG